MDISTGVPEWEMVGDVGQRLAWSNLTLLPDGRVMISGGSSEDNKLVDVAFETYFWERTTHEVTVGASQSEERLYHSTTLLMPDGSVMSAGGGAPGPILQDTGEFYRPDYFFNEDGSLADRIEVIDLQAEARPGEDFTLTVEDGATVSRVTMLKHGATTHAVKGHHFDLVRAAYLEDEETRAFIEDANPAALAEIAERLSEAMERGMWTPRSNSARALIERLLRN